MGGGKKSNKIFECFGVRADERSGDKFGVFFRGVSGVELGDDHHTLPALLFAAPPPMLGALPPIAVRSGAYNSAKHTIANTQNRYRRRRERFKRERPHGRHHGG